MSVINNGILLGAGADAAVGYQISRSLRFNSADSAYLNRTPGSAGDRNKWTFSCWVKLGAGLANNIFSVFTANSGNTGLIIRSGSVGSPYQIEFFTQSGATVPLDLITTRVFRDYGAWFHLLFYFDLANSTQADRAQIYINGVRETNFSTNTNTISTSSVGRDINNTSEHRIGAGNGYADGYLADVHFCDGYAYDPSYFTETDAITGQLIPKAFTGSYGTNGFRLPFSDNSGTTAATLGKDSAGSNNWTPNNFSVASGAGNDSLVDSPTGYGTDTGAGGEVRGNYCTWNPLDNAGTLANGNLDFSQSSAAFRNVRSTFAISSGKWYWEGTVSTLGGAAYIGIGTAAASLTSNIGDSNTFGYVNDGKKQSGNTAAVTYGASYTTGDVIGVAFDADNGTLTFYKNGTSQGQAYSGLTSGPYFFMVTGYNGTLWAANFGARAFSSTAPSGYKALCSHNLPEPTILQGNTAMDVALYTGNGSTQTITLTGGMSPDLVWIKGRSVAYGHRLLDIVRGATNALASSSTAAEFVESNGVTAFNATGFSLGSDVVYNENASTFVAWAWDAGSSTVTNTSGSISSQVRASATNGCSVVTYTGTGSNATVGHGLGVAPSLIIGKARSFTQVWVAGHTSIGWGNYLLLNATDASTSSANVWNNTAPTSTVFSLGTGTGLNTSSATYVAYCFAPVAGFSAFGSYTGNGSTTDNTFVFTGMRPRFVLLKRSDSTGNWVIWDAVRNSYNVANSIILPNTSAAEYSPDAKIDILSNGFKVRDNSSDSGTNAATYIYAAFAESPFKYSRAR